MSVERPGYVILELPEMVSHHIVEIIRYGYFILTDYLRDFQDTVMELLADIDLFPLSGGQCRFAYESLFVTGFSSLLLSFGFFPRLFFSCREIGLLFPLDNGRFLRLTLNAPRLWRYAVIILPE